MKRTSEQSLQKKGKKTKGVITTVKSKSIKEMFNGIALRPRKPKSYVPEEEKVEHDEEFEPQIGEEDDDDFMVEPKKKKKLKKGVGHVVTPKSKELDFDDIYEDESNAKAEELEEALNKIPKTRKQLEKLAETVEDRLAHFKQQFIQEQADMEKKKSAVSENAIPICADVTTFDFKKLAEVQSKVGGRLFDVIMMDPPWQLSSSQPSRGVAIAYQSLGDDFIQKIPIPKLQTNGFIFIWTINAKYAITVKLMEHWGYKLVDEITWIKKTINGKIAKGHGFYLQHAKESCLIGVKGKIDSSFQKNIGSDIIFSQRRGQSQKPEEIYELIEKLIPNGFYLEIFGRRNNLRDRWVTIGNEL